MLYRNRLKEAIQTSGLAIGTFVQMASAENAEIAAASGFDFVILDMEHGSFGIETLVELIRGVQVAGATPIVRLPDDSETGILKALDAGATGVLVLGISDAEEIRKVVSAARYAPLGCRGACPRVRATGHGLYDWERHVEWSTQNVMVWALIESVEGFKNLEGIVATPGLDAVAFGPFDLSQEMGLKGQTDHPEVRKQMEKAMTLARERGIDILTVLFESSPDEVKKAARRWMELGSRIIASMSDRRVLAKGFKDLSSCLASIR